MIGWDGNGESRPLSGRHTGRRVKAVYIFLFRKKHQCSTSPSVIDEGDFFILGKFPSTAGEAELPQAAEENG